MGIDGTGTCASGAGDEEIHSLCCESEIIGRGAARAHHIQVEGDRNPVAQSYCAGVGSSTFLRPS